MTAVLLALALASAGALWVASILVGAAVGSAFYARHLLSLAGRSRIGARSEDEVRRALRALEAEGWQVRHGLRWGGRGDIDFVAIAPSGIGFVVETKTRAYDGRHLRIVWEQAAWLSRRRRRWCRHGAVPVLCAVRGAGLPHWQDGVIVLSLDELTRTLREVADIGSAPSLDRSRRADVAPSGLGATLP